MPIYFHYTQPSRHILQPTYLRNTTSVIVVHTREAINTLMLTILVENSRRGN